MLILTRPRSAKPSRNNVTATARSAAKQLAMKNKTADTINRRTFLATSLVAGATIAMSEPLVAQTKRKKTFTILHTNELQSNLSLGHHPLP